VPRVCLYVCLATHADLLLSPPRGAGDSLPFSPDRPTRPVAPQRGERAGGLCVWVECPLDRPTPGGGCRLTHHCTPALSIDCPVSRCTTGPSLIYPFFSTRSVPVACGLCLPSEPPAGLGCPQSARRPRLFSRSARRAEGVLASTATVGPLGRRAWTGRSSDVTQKRTTGRGARPAPVDASAAATSAAHAPTVRGRHTPAPLPRSSGATVRPGSRSRHAPHRAVTDGAGTSPLPAALPRPPPGTITPRNGETHPRGQARAGAAVPPRRPSGCPPARPAPRAAPPPTHVAGAARAARARGVPGRSAPARRPAGRVPPGISRSRRGGAGERRPRRAAGPVDGRAGGQAGERVGGWAGGRAGGRAGGSSPPPTGASRKRVPVFSQLDLRN